MRTWVGSRQCIVFGQTAVAVNGGMHRFPARWLGRLTLVCTAFGE
ncbi:hypothetical protein [Nonomuraea sp. JJY05]